MQAQADLTKANAIEFSVRDESWIKYKLEDGTQLFGRLVTPKIFKADEYDPSGQPIYAGPARTSSQPSVQDPSEERPRILLQHPSTRATANTTAVDFERVGSERWNVYELSNGTVLRAKLEVTSILRTDRYGPDGDPLYVVNNQPITRIKVPEALIRKQQTIRKDTRPTGLYG